MGPMRSTCTYVRVNPLICRFEQGDEIVYIERAVSERSGMQVARVQWAAGRYT
jgi:hypothetical protein